MPAPLQLMANAIRMLSLDAVEQANCGHPGMPMGMADVATVLWTKVLKYDAAATDLSDCFTNTPDFTPFTLKSIDKAIFDPAKVKDPLDPAPDSPRMDDPKVIRELNRR